MARGVLAAGVAILGILFAIFTYDFFSTLISHITESMTKTIAWTGYIGLTISVILIIPVFLATSETREGEFNG